jgi:hypothetical protein
MPEVDMMICRSCGNQERASEGYPCQECGTFVCLICDTRGISHCKNCRQKLGMPEPANLPAVRP